VIILVTLAGGLAVAGPLLLVRELRGISARPLIARPSLMPALPSLSSAGRRHLLIALIAGIVVLVVTRWPVAGIAATAGVILVPKVTGHTESRRRIEVLEGLEQWIRRLGDMLTAGRALEDALETSAGSAPVAIAEPVLELAARLSARTGSQDALRSFAASIDDPAADRIAAALIIATSRHGGAARDVLAALASLLARDVVGRRQTEADRAEHRTTLRWITVFMVGYTVYLLVNKSFSAPYGTLQGQAVLAMVAAIYAAAMFWLHRLAQISVPGRFLNSDQHATYHRPAGPQPVGASARRAAR
jgi:Flp pilus assembly protein TadB